MDISKLDKGECANGGEACMPDSIVKEIAKSENIPTKSKVKAVEMLKKVLECEKEACIVKKKLTPHDASNVLSTYFKPVGPRDSNDLLSDSNIDSVLYQWTHKYDFRHIGFQMRDFMESSNELSNYDIVAETKPAMACVLNTDYSSGPGIHWVCLFCDFTADPITIEYFNSTGNMPLHEFHVWMNQAVMHLNKEGRSARSVIVSNIQHQIEDTECGVYSLYYIYSRLNGIPHSAFNSHKRFTDKMVEEFRQVVFSSGWK